MSTSEQRAAWDPNYFTDAGNRATPGSAAKGAERTAMPSYALAVALLAVLALGSAIQAVLYPELLSEIFVRF